MVDGGVYRGIKDACDWQKKNLEKVQKNHRNLFHERRLKAFDLLGNKCVQCAETDWRCLQIDHINGGGQKERKKFPSHKMFYMYVLKQLRVGSKDYQCLCANCNWIKRWENKE